VVHPVRFFGSGPFKFGSAPRTLPDERGDGANNFDVSFFKNFAIRILFEAKAQIRRCADEFGRRSQSSAVSRAHLTTAPACEDDN
jgi:hypothetical protein